MPIWETAAHFKAAGYNASAKPEARFLILPASTYESAGPDWRLRRARPRGLSIAGGMRRDLERTGQLVVIDQEVDPYLEVAAIQRRVYQAGGPALLFRRVKGTAFPMLGNLFGTLDRTRFLFRDTLEAVRRLVELKVDPGAFARHPWRYRGAALTHWRLLPRRVRVRADPGASDDASTGCRSSSAGRCDGGAFVTLPQVYTEDPDRPGLARSNLGMYRVQLAGNQYEPDREVGLHYQIHRGIGVHHAAAIRRGEPLRVNVFVGGPPALTVAAVMPLPEGLPELAFAGALGGRRVAHGRPGRDVCRCPPRPTSSSAASIDPHAAQARGAVRRPPRLLQPPARLPGARASSASITATGRSGRSRRWAGRRRKTRRSAR